MARGFWTGLGHGAALSGGVLVLMSLIWPLPVPITTGTPPADGAAATASRDPQPDGAAAPGTPAEVSPVASEDAVSARPSAEAVGLPVGSEFGRGGDVVPRLPAPMTAPTARLEQSDAPAVSAPAAEPAPVAITGDDARPAPPVDQPDAPRPAAGEDSPRFSQPAPGDAPVARSAPAMALTAGQDQLPQPSVADAIAASDMVKDEAGPAGRPASESEPMPAEADDSAPSTDADAAPGPDTATTALPAAAGPSAPALPSPVLDLSLPPDLSDLRGFERN